MSWVLSHCDGHIPQESLETGICWPPTRNISVFVITSQRLKTRIHLPRFQIIRLSYASLFSTVAFKNILSPKRGIFPAKVPK